VETYSDKIWNHTNQKRMKYKTLKLKVLRKYNVICESTKNETAVREKLNVWIKEYRHK
jgi:hypothetical protein